MSERVADLRPKAWPDAAAPAGPPSVDHDSEREVREEPVTCGGPRLRSSFDEHVASAASGSGIVHIGERPEADVWARVCGTTRGERRCEPQRRQHEIDVHRWPEDAEAGAKRDWNGWKLTTIAHAQAASVGAKPGGYDVRLAIIPRLPVHRAGAGRDAEECCRPTEPPKPHTPSLAASCGRFSCKAAEPEPDAWNARSGSAVDSRCSPVVSAQADPPRRHHTHGPDARVLHERPR